MVPVRAGGVRSAEARVALGGGQKAARAEGSARAAIMPSPLGREGLLRGEVDGAEVLGHVEVELGALREQRAPVRAAGAVGALAEVALPGLPAEVAKVAEDALEVGVRDADNHPPVGGLVGLGVDHLRQAALGGELADGVLGDVLEVGEAAGGTGPVADVRGVDATAGVDFDVDVALLDLEGLKEGLDAGIFTDHRVDGGVGDADVAVTHLPAEHDVVTVVEGAEHGLGVMLQALFVPVGVFAGLRLRPDGILGVEVGEAVNLVNRVFREHGCLLY